MGPPRAVHTNATIGACVACRQCRAIRDASFNAGISHRQSGNTRLVVRRVYWELFVVIVPRWYIRSLTPLTNVHTIIVADRGKFGQDRSRGATGDM